MNDDQPRINAHRMIQDPGPFEGSPLWTWYAYTDSMDGCWETIESNEAWGNWTIINTDVDASMLCEWHASADDAYGIVAALLECDSQGFISGVLLNHESYQQLLKEMAGVM